MSSADKPRPKELTPQETAAILDRILEGVEKTPHRHWLQIVGAIMLSLSTTCSAWCAYQSKLWGGVQMVRMAATGKAIQLSSTAQIEAIQARTFDAAMFFSYMQAKHDGNERQEKFLFDRFRPEMKKAVDAWLSTDPFNNPAAPQGPFKMGEYVQHHLAEAKLQEERAAQQFASAQEAHHQSDTYMLLTVMFASVLFFGGLSATLDWFRLRIIVFTLALALFLVTVSFLATMPICKV